nr:MAG TPA: hypothetical protein [Caudoviricetes sp.]
MFLVYLYFLLSKLLAHSYTRPLIKKGHHIY